MAGKMIMWAVSFGCAILFFLYRRLRKKTGKTNVVLVWF